MQDKGEVLRHVALVVMCRPTSGVAATGHPACDVVVSDFGRRIRMRLVGSASMCSRALSTFQPLSCPRTAPMPILLTPRARRWRSQRNLLAGALVLATVPSITACTEHPTRPESAVRPPESPSRLIVPSSETYLKVGVGAQFSCALRSNGVIECFGFNGLGGGPARRQAQVGTYTDLDVGGYNACALRSDGVMQCWDNDVDDPIPLVTPPAGHVFTQVSAGGNASCGLRDDGVAECIGTFSANGTKEGSSGGFTHLSAGSYSVCGVTTAGVVECWGHNDWGQAPASKSASTGVFVQVSSASESTCALRNDGVVECWGPNSKGEAPSMRSASSGHYFTAVSRFFYSTCALREDGVIECWGENDYGQAPATKTAAASKFVQISTGSGHSCAVRADGAIECWGIDDDRAPRLRTTAIRVNPTATFVASTSVIVTSPISLALLNAQVPGYPSATSFTYRFSCGSGLSTASAINTATCPTSVAGTISVVGRVVDQDGDYATYTAQVQVKTAAQGTADLQAAISGATLTPDLRKALSAKLNAALDALAKGKTAVACSALQDFINQVQAQRGKAISLATADQWIVQATQLRQALGC